MGLQPELIQSFLRKMHLWPPASGVQHDLDEDAFGLWCHGDCPDKQGRLRKWHPHASDEDITAALGHGLRLYEITIATPLATIRRDASLDEVRSALEREIPGMSARAYKSAAEIMISCFMTYDQWM